MNSEEYRWYASGYAAGTLPGGKIVLDADPAFCFAYALGVHHRSKGVAPLGIKDSANTIVVLPVEPTPGEGRRKPPA